MKGGDTMDNVYLQLDTRTSKLKVEVNDATDIRYAISSMWSVCGDTGSFGRYADLVHEDGSALDSEEREAFFDEVDADCEIALGDCWLVASLEFSQSLTSEQSTAILNIVNNTPHTGFVVSLYSHSELVLQTKDEIHFSAYPNRNVRVRTSRYDGIETDACFEASGKIKAINKLITDLGDTIKRELGIELNGTPFNPDWFDFKGDCTSYGDYRIIDFGELLYDYVAF
jgi:hypothetical protein